MKVVSTVLYKDASCCEIQSYFFYLVFQITALEKPDSVTDSRILNY